MNCVRFEMRLDELLDERLPLDSDIELNEHIETCSRCARLLADHQVLLEVIERIARPEVRRELAARVLAEITPEPVSIAVLCRSADAVRPVVSAWGAASWIAATVAAALLVGVGGMEWRVFHHAATFAESKAPELDPPKLAAEQPAGNAAISNGTANDRDPLAMRSVAEMQALPSLIGPQQWTLMEQMTDGLKPVTHSMSAALNALRHTLPGSEKIGARG